MKLKKITSQSRRDFYGDYECENCGYLDKNVSGYDDDYFHSKVTPNMKCKKCGESTLSQCKEVQLVRTKYHEGFQI